MVEVIVISGIALVLTGVLSFVHARMEKYRDMLEESTASLELTEQDVDDILEEAVDKDKIIAELENEKELCLVRYGDAVKVNRGYATKLNAIRDILQQKGLK